ncbi:hypothetical protein MMC17_000355 [Xylographa soralifera]|nr:hypothetical protein [Xylographa soralifera]
MASFGFGVGDLVLLSQIAWSVVQNARAACGEYDVLADEASAIHVVLTRLQKEASNPESLISMPDNAEEFLEIVIRCKKVLRVLDRILKKYNAMPEDDKKLQKLWKRMKFGNGEMQDLGQLRSKLTYYTAVVTLFLNRIAVGSLGKIEQQMNTAGGELRDIRLAVNNITANLLAQNREGSVLTAYENDDTAVWKEFRRELVLEGFASSVIHKHKSLIKAYVKELGDRGLLDGPEKAEFETPSVRYSKHDHQEDIFEEEGHNRMQQAISDDEGECREDFSSAKDQSNINIMKDNFTVRNIRPQGNTPHYPLHASVESDIDEDETPAWQSFRKDQMISHHEAIENADFVAEATQEVAETSVEFTTANNMPGNLKQPMTARQTFFAQNITQIIAQKLTEANIRQGLTSYTVYAIRDVHSRYSLYGWNTTLCEFCPFERTMVDDNSRIFDSSLRKIWLKADYDECIHDEGIVKSTHVLITMLKFTPEQLKLEITHDSNANEKNPVFEWTLAQLSFRYWGSFRWLLVKLQRAPGQVADLETLMREHIRAFPDGRPEQTRMAPSLPRKAVNHGNGFGGTYYTGGFQLTTNLNFVWARARSEKNPHPEALAMVHVPAPKKKTRPHRMPEPQSPSGQRPKSNR